MSHKIAEDFFEEGGHLIHKRTFDTNAAIAEAAYIRDALPNGDMGEMRCIGSVPMWLFNEWLEDAGVAWNDPAANDVLRRKLLDGSFAALQIGKA